MDKQKTSMLIIVESPTKARTLTRFLGEGYNIKATMGHIRDLPQNRLGVNINDNFDPTYQILPKKKDLVEELKKDVFRRKENNLVLATDPDREGEAIAWHIKEALLKRPAKENKNKKVNINRIVFHEITKTAIEEALKNPREIDINLVESQQGRRILDRLVGYKLSPILWYKTGKRWLSAGRVQSVAVRLIVERENEIEDFKTTEYWDVFASLKAKTGTFQAQLIKIEDKAFEIKNKTEADNLVADLNKQKYQVADVRQTRQFRAPPPPFTTATMQRAAANLFYWSAKRTMSLAQELYEKGLITYHRTDSVNIAAVALGMARKYIGETYGQKYLPDAVRIYKTKSRLAQEAHEAIRPTSLEIRNSKSEIRTDLEKDHFKLLDLITKRFVASQMNDEEVERTTADIKAGEKYLFQAKGERVIFEGWRILYKEESRIMNQESRKKQNSEKKNSNNETDNKILPPLTIGEILELLKIIPLQKFTQPPARYNEASLIKALEEKGIGRPSTYAPIITTIQQRQYVEKIERRFLKPTELGSAINKFLIDNFADIINVEFTAKMEEELDQIAEGKTAWLTVIKEFWNPFSEKLVKVKDSDQKIKMKVETLDEKCPLDGGQLVIRLGRFGKFVACVNYPNCKFTKQLVQKIDVKCPKCVGDVIIRKTKTGRHFFGCSNYPKCNFASWTKPTTENKNSNPQKEK